MADSALPDDTALASPPGSGRLFVAFAMIGLSAIGGGLSGWMLREFVHRRRWISEEEFFAGLALAQAFPGINVVNLAIWIGFRLRGSAGAAASSAGIIVPPAILAIVVITAFDRISRFPLVIVFLTGAAAAAIGLSLAVGARAALNIGRRVVPLAIMAATFVALFILRWPLFPVIGVMAPLSIGLAFWQIRTGA